MELKQAFRLFEYPRLALVGAGGKTSTLFQLAREINPPVIISATAHLAVEQTQLADQHIRISTFEDTNQLYEIAKSGVILVTGPEVDSRIAGLPADIMAWLRDYCGYYSLPLLIEADGSRRLSLKAPADHEPPIPPFCDTVVVVAGLEHIRKPLSAQYVHRPEIFASLARMNLADQITPEAVANVLCHPAGGLKNIPPKARKIAFLTQANTPQLQKLGIELAHSIQHCYDGVVVASFDNQPPGDNPHQNLQKSLTPLAVLEPIAGIVLAAGAAQRYGSPKQMLQWEGKAFVNHVVQTALAAGLSPVRVVSGAYHADVKKSLENLPVEVVYNSEWAQGQSSSVRAGIKALPRQTGGAIFFLVDQPQIPTALVQKLKLQHAKSLAPIVAPWVANRRGNPVLFDCSAFKDLESLQGDAGGRQLFAKFGFTKVEWEDADILLDVDTPEIYQRVAMQ